VFYVPDIRKNLLSDSQAQRRGTKFEFTPTEGRAILSYDRDQIISDSLNGLYVLNSVNKDNISAYSVISNPTPETWHRRFGHANIPGIYKLHQHQLVMYPKIRSQWNQYAMPVN
jgi:hypothetical protein